MAEEPKVLDFLREQFARVHQKLDRLTADVGEIRQRLTTLEIQIGGLAATEQSHYAQTMLRLDRFGERLDRIEKRLDLADEPV
jgi:phage shock protein A